MMQLIKTTGLVLIVLSSFQMLVAQHTHTSRLKVQGNQFVSETGEKIILRGLNTSDPDYLAAQRHWNHAYFRIGTIR